MIILCYISMFKWGVVFNSLLKIKYIKRDPFMIFTKNITVPPLSGRQKRRAYIYVPDDFKKNPDARYPVLYMFDGHNVFFDSHATYGKSWGMLDWLKKTKAPLIVAAVECNHGINNERLSEYSPFNFSDPSFGEIKGKGKVTMDWYVNFFKPYVDSHFPTMPEREYTFIAGSSMGGLMTLYAVCRYNHIFSRGAALSPSVSFAPHKVEMFMEKAEILPGTVLYIDYGEEELGRRSNTLYNLNCAAYLMAQKGVMVTNRLIPGGTHTEASWEKQIPFFMDILFYNL